MQIQVAAQRQAAQMKQQILGDEQLFNQLLH